MVLDHYDGGDLRFHLARQKGFSEIQTKFFVACLLVALDYVHQKGIIHRDIKPENLIFDNEGFLKLGDFGIARNWKDEASCETSGTPGYMAPEAMCKFPQQPNSDFYGIGIIIYECIYGEVS